MNGFRWTLHHLRVAEQALERRRNAVRSGDAEPGPIMAEPGCERACLQCDLECSVIAACIETTRQGLARQERDKRPAWELSHAGRSYATAAGRA